MSHSWFRRACALAVAGAVAIPITATTTTSTAVADPAARQAESGEITYTVGDPDAFLAPVYIADADGGGVRTLEQQVATGSTLVWAPDGSRYAYWPGFAGTSLVLRRYDGSDEVQLVRHPDAPIADMAWTPDGRYIVYVADNKIWFVAADGSRDRGMLYEPDPDHVIGQITVAPDYTIAFVQDPQDWSPRVLQLRPGDDEPTLLLGGNDPMYSPDGRYVAFTQFDPDVRQPLLYIRDLDSGSDRYVYTDLVGVYEPVWSPEGDALLYASGLTDEPDAVHTVNLDNGRETVVLDDVPMVHDVSWQPVVDNDVVRIWGNDHVATGIATSQMGFATDGADAVVLSRDDTYLDALVGSAFAVHENASLLLTNRAELDPRVEREIGRVLTDGSTVYLLGGSVAIRPEVEQRLVDLGYNVERIWGRTHFDTAVALNQRITTDPEIAIVTTAATFYDALAAGAAAGANPGTVIALTDGRDMPQATTDYLDGLNPEYGADGTGIVTVGGPGNTALVDAYENDQLPSWPDRLFYWPLVGANEMDTAVAVAEWFFAAPSVSGVATNRTWLDALAGGTLLGANDGPLLITQPDRLNPGVRDYLSTSSGSMDITAMFGGQVALSDDLIEPLGDAISLPGRWNYTSVQPRVPMNTPMIHGSRPSATDKPLDAGMPGLAGEAATATR